MKKWTVVIEITDDCDPDPLTKEEIEFLLINDCPAGISFQVFECTPYPYGPDGVILTEARKNTRL